MSNNWFRFKQFVVKQEGAAMKVGTDGVLLGAWAGTDTPDRILDVGTGTGLLALMLAQRFPDALIDAVEIDPSAYNQARENFQNSSWSNRLNLVQSSFQDFLMVDTKYDLIICNPPYFIRSAIAPSASRTLARHNAQLSRAELITGSVAIMNQNASLSVILPFLNSEDFISEAESNGLHLMRSLGIRPLPDKSFKRVMLEFGFEITQPSHSEIIVEMSRHRYSDEYTSLCRDFYLKM